MIARVVNARVFSRPAGLALGIVLLLCVLLTISGTPASFAQAAALKWSRPIPLSGALAGSRLPALVAQDDGNVFLFWNFTGDGNNTIFVSKYDNGAWLRPTDVLVGGPRVLVMMDGRDYLHLLFNQDALLTLATAAAAQATSVQGWESGTTITHGNGGLYGDMLLNSDGSLDVVWLESTTACQKCYSVAFEKHGSETPVDLSYRVLSDVESVPQERLQILRAPAGTLYVMWDRGAQGNTHAGVAVSVSTNNGVKWADGPRLVSFDQDIREPLMFLDQAKQLVLVYNYGNRDEVYYSVSGDDGTTWTQPQPIPGLFANKLASSSDYFAAATDNAGISHLIADGRASKEQQLPALYHIAWDGKQWNNLNEIYHGDTLVENPAIAIGNGNRLHVSFATRNRNAGDDISTSQVWYTNAQTDAPAATRVPLPTFTPVPSATNTPTPIPNATRLPAPTPIQSDSTTNISKASSINTQLPIIAGIVPVVLILLGVFIWATTFRRRR